MCCVFKILQDNIALDMLRFGLFAWLMSICFCALCERTNLNQLCGGAVANEKLTFFLFNFSLFRYAHKEKLYILYHSLKNYVHMYILYHSLTNLSRIF